MGDYHTIKLDDVQFSAQNFTANLQGGDVASLLNQFSGTFTEFVNSFIMRKFNQDMIDALQMTVNSNLMGLKTQQDITDLGVEVDYRLLQDGIHVTDDFISMVIDGTFHPMNSYEADSSSKSYN
mmetsp:Transcript_6694/g.10756  ORF Transcript_6694/g.10756 Transcript_6694/m.10756 type:complete len:124 (+) Transcript_6694:506-877(+)